MGGSPKSLKIKSRAQQRKRLPQISLQLAKRTGSDIFAEGPEPRLFDVETDHREQRDMSNFTYELARFIPFRDRAVCERVRNIRKEDLCNHPNPNFKIRIIEDANTFSFSYVLDIVAGIKRALDESEGCASS